MKTRNYGVDLLRLTAMFFVLLLHNLGQGGLLGQTVVGTANWWSLHLLENAALVAVNVFAILTGYLTMGRPFKSRRLVEVVVQTCFWAVVMTIVVMLFGYHYSLSQLIHLTVPLWTHWYVKAYLGMMLIGPLLSIAQAKLSAQTYLRMVSVLLVASVTVGWLGQLFLLSGYSAYWLMVMYLVGGFFQLHQPKRAAHWYLLVYLGLTVISTFGQYAMAAHGHGFGSLTSYVSPLIVLASIALVKWGMGLNITAAWAQRWLKRCAGVAFGVYLIDASGSFYYRVLPQLHTWLNHFGAELPLVVLILSLGMFLLFMAADYLRLVLFKQIHAPQAIAWLDRRLKQLADWLGNGLKA